MLGWSINLFRIRGIQLSVHVSFLLLLAYAADLGWRDGGWIGLAWSVATLLAFFTCVVLHELGHSFAAMHFGIRVRRILLMPIGGMAQFEDIPRQPSRELWITVAGPAVNFAIAGLLALWVGAPRGFFFDDYEFPADGHGFAQLLLGWNLVMGLFNLIPVFPMDGGRIFRALLAMRRPYLQATLWAATLGKTLAVTAALLVLFVSEGPLENRLLTAGLFVFIFFAAGAEYRGAQHREWVEAHARAKLAQHYAGMPVPLEQPPLLSR